MKRTSHAVLRVAASALVVLIWVIYLFERWSGQYAMYPLIGYVGYECLSIVAGACFWALLIWLLAVLIQVLRRKAPKRDLAFAALLAVMLSAMSVYNTWLSGFQQITTLASLSSLSRPSGRPFQARFHTQDGQELTLSCPDVLAHALGPASTVYLITYTAPADGSGTGALCGAQRTPE